MFNESTITSNNTELENTQNDFLSANDIPHTQTKVGLRVSFIRSFFVSDDGDQIWGFNLTNNENSKIIRQSFSSEMCLFYAYEHYCGISLMVYKDHNLLVSGGKDKKIVSIILRKETL